MIGFRQGADHPIFMGSRVDRIIIRLGRRCGLRADKIEAPASDARKGNEQIIRDDFKKSVHDAYDQAVHCATCLGDERLTLTPADGPVVVLPYEMKAVYVTCARSPRLANLFYKLVWNNFRLFSRPRERLRPAVNA
jgi:hypothetical protein